MSEFDWMLQEVEAPTGDRVASNNSGYDWMLGSADAPEESRADKLRRLMDKEVAEIRANSWDGNYVRDTIGNIARGTPIGSWLDETAAGISSGLYNVTGGTVGSPYDVALEYARAHNRAIDAESTKIGELPVVGDVTVGGATKLAGGLASAVATPMIAPLRGTSILPTAGNAAATGATYGAVYGAGEGDGVSERAANSAVGSLAGAAFGPAAVGAGNAVGGIAGAAARGVTALRQGNPNRPIIGQGADQRAAHPGAVSRVDRAFEDDGMANQRAYQARAGAIGDDGTLLDVGPNLKGQGGAIANSPGEGKARIEGALRSRERLANDRINAAADDALGPRQNLEQSVADRLSDTRAAAGPLYDAFYNTRLPPTPALQKIIERVVALDPGIDEKIARMLKADGANAKLVENGGIIYDYMSKRLGDLYDEVQGDNAKRLVAKVRKALQQEVENIERSVSGTSNWAAARREAAKGLQYREGTEQAAEMFKPGVTYDRFAFMNQNASPDTMDGLRAGGRDVIRQKMDSATTAFATRDGRAASKGRLVLSPEQTRQKLRFAAEDDQAANRLMRRMDAEGIYAETLNDVLGNSATAGRQAAQREFPSSLPSGSDTGRSIGYRTWEGATAEAGYRILNWMTQGALDERRIMIAADAAEMLVARGAKRDELARFFQQQAQRREASAQTRRALGRIAELVARGSMPSAVGGAVAHPNSTDIAGGLAKGAAMGVLRR